MHVYDLKDFQVLDSDEFKSEFVWNVLESDQGCGGEGAAG